MEYLLPTVGTYSRTVLLLLKTIPLLFEYSDLLQQLVVFHLLVCELILHVVLHTAWYYILFHKCDMQIFSFYQKQLEF